MIKRVASSSSVFLGFGGKEYTEEVERNSSLQLIFLHQVHGREIVRFDGRTESEVVGDGWFLSIKECVGSGMGFSIRTADCLPVVMQSDQHIALVHAGWRGLQEGILHAAVLCFRDVHDEPQHIAFGPAADPALYEVGEEFQQYFSESGAVKGHSSQWYFDIQCEASFQLRMSGYTGDIDLSEKHTISSKRYYSHRVDPASTKRNYTVALFSSLE